jgi:subtilisin family serine protease
MRRNIDMDRSKAVKGSGSRTRSFIRTVAALAGVTIAFALAGLSGPDDALGNGDPAASFSGTREYIVLFEKDVDLKAGIRREIRRGNEVEDRFSSLINGAILELGAEDVNRLRADDRVLAIERDRRVGIADSRSSNRSSGRVLPWGLDRINQRSLPLDGTVSQDSNGAEVTAYVIDTGIRLDHKEFNGRINPEGFTAHGRTTNDCEGHGTHVAGTIAGSTFGVAPAARLTAVKALNCRGFGNLSDIIAGIDWMISDHRVGSRGLSSQVVTGRSNPDRETGTPRTKATMTAKRTDDSRYVSRSSGLESTSIYGTGAVQDLKHSSISARYNYQISATTKSSICDGSGYCGWFPVAYAFPASQQCRPSSDGGAFAWVGHFQSSPGTQTSNQWDRHLPGSSPWRFCIYVYGPDSDYHLVHDAVLSPVLTNPGEPVIRPVNDDFTSRQELNSLEPFSGSSIGATAETGEPDHYRAQSPRKSVWWGWTAPGDGRLVLDTSGSSFDTILAVYTGNSIDKLVGQASDDDSGEGRASRVSLEVKAGAQYAVAVDGYSGASGSIQLAGSFTENRAPDPVDPVPDPVDPVPDPVDPVPDPVDPEPTAPEPVAPRAAVANLSLGDGESEVLNEAIQRAVEAGITVVVAAGNESRDACDYSPASAPGAITVGSISVSDRASYFSNHGPCVDLFAPGEQILSAGRDNPRATTMLSGTSMATPHVAGAAALILGDDKDASPRDVTDRLLETATEGVVAGLNSSTVNRLLYIPGSTPRLSSPDGDVLSHSRLTSATLILAASREGTYECSLDGGDWKPCRPGRITYSKLSLGNHEVRLRGSLEGKPVRELTASWRYVPAAPVISRAPRRSGTSRRALFRLKAIKGLRVQCRINGRAWQICGSSKRYRGLRPGRHTFQVRQISGELVSPAAKWGWKVLRKKKAG